MTFDRFAVGFLEMRECEQRPKGQARGSVEGEGKSEIEREGWMEGVKGNRGGAVSGVSEDGQGDHRSRDEDKN
jgi:hypothetical protein